MKNDFPDLTGILLERVLMPYKDFELHFMKKSFLTFKKCAIHSFGSFVNPMEIF